MSDYDAIVDTFVEWAVGEPRARALWLEGRSPAEIRRPYRSLELHVAADEPDLEALAMELPKVTLERTDAQLVEMRDAGRRARDFRFRHETAAAAPGGDGPPRIEETRWSIVLEATSMLAKRPRAYVATLVDRTQHLAHVMDFSLRGT